MPGDILPTGGSTRRMMSSHDISNLHYVLLFRCPTAISVLQISRTHYQASVSQVTPASNSLPVADCSICSCYAILRLGCDRCRKPGSTQESFIEFQTETLAPAAMLDFGARRPDGRSGASLRAGWHEVDDRQVASERRHLRGTRRGHHPPVQRFRWRHRLTQ